MHSLHKNLIASRDKTQKAKAGRTRTASIFLMVVLTLSVVTLGMATAATANAEKFFLALFLQYVGRDAQVNIYKPNMSERRLYTSSCTRMATT